MYDYGSISVYIKTDFRIVQQSHASMRIHFPSFPWCGKILDWKNTLIEHSNVSSLTRCEKEYLLTQKNNEELLGYEIPYRALMYLANNIRPHIAFTTNLLVRYNSSKQKDIRTKLNMYFVV